MEHGEQANPTPAAQREGLELQAAGPRLSRALERAALRDLAARRRDAWQAQDEAVARRIAELRRERNERMEALDRAALALRTKRELELGEQRLPWIDAHEQTVAAKRQMGAALKADRAENAADEAAELERLRTEHQRARAAFDEEARALDQQEGVAVVALRAAWNEARGRVLEARAALWQATRAQRRAQRAPQVTSGPAAQAWADAHKANLAYAEAVSLWRKTERSGNASAAELVNLHHHAAELRARAEAAEQAARQLEEAALATLPQAPEPDPAQQELEQLRVAYDEARGQVAEESAQARAAVRAHKAARKEELRRARRDLIERRRAEGDAYAAAVQEVYRARGLREADLRADWVDKNALEHEALLAARAATRAQASATRPALAEQLEHIRIEKNAVADAYRQQVSDLWRDRDLARGEEREAARQAAAAALARYREQSR